MRLKEQVSRGKTRYLRLHYIKNVLKNIDICQTFSSKIDFFGRDYLSL